MKKIVVISRTIKLKFKWCQWLDPRSISSSSWGSQLAKNKLDML